MFYFVKTPWWVKRWFNNRIWEMPGNRKVIYLSFDDGPDPFITPFVLDELKKYNAKATFFCIGKKLPENPAVYERILSEGHAVGNHSFDHLNGWKTKDAPYLANIATAQKYINSNLFRPPYGRMTRSQQKILSAMEYQYKIIMWSVLSGDFDESISPEQCCANVIKNTGSGAIVVFHDSEKANTRMRYSLPVVLKYFSDQGYTFEKIQFK